MSEVSEDRDDLLAAVFSGDRDAPWEPSEKISIVIKEIERLKLEMKNYLKECELNITELAEESTALCQESRETTEQLEACEREIEMETMADVLESMQDHNAIAHDLEKVNFSLHVVYDVVHCGKYFKEYDEYRRADNYTAAAERLVDITDFLTTPAEGFSQLTMYDTLKSSVQLHWDDMLQELTKHWEKMIQYEVQEGQDLTHVEIRMNLYDTRTHVDVLLALNMCKQLRPKISEFGQFLLKHVLTPLTRRDCTMMEESTERIAIVVNNGNCMRPGYDLVIRNVRSVFNLLSKKLSIEVQAADTILSLMGKEIAADFADVIVRDCFTHTIPSSLAELKDYNNTIADVGSLEKFLVSIGFFPKENVTLLHYASNLDESFADKTSQHFLGVARNTMLTDMSYSMSIGVESVPVSEETPVTVEASVEEALKVLNDTLPKSLFYFPRCMISRSTQDLLNLVHSMMDQASQCSDLVCRRLYVTARLIFELYESVVPYHHENFLLTIPQYVALFHNNCMYLAHNLLTLGEKWCMSLEGRGVDYPISFLDLVPRLRSLAYKHLTLHLQQQRKQILDNIRSSDLNSIVVKDVLGENAEQAIRQCLRQLQLLKNVWIGVFPPNVFRRLMACLVNMFVEEIIHRVCTVEDISAEMATQLADMYKIVVKKIPNLFPREQDLVEHVKCWEKLQELILVLGGSLKDIEKRWGDGSGPLAVHFRIEELRTLIKALFQNTQFRANLLAKIK